MEWAHDDLAQHVLSQAARLAAGEELNRVADHHRKTDRDKKELQRACLLASHRLPHDPVENERDPSRRGDRQRRRRPERQAERVHSQGQVRAKRQQIAMGEIDDAQRAENERKAHGAEREVPGRDETVERRLPDRHGAARNGERDSDGDKRGRQPNRYRRVRQPEWKPPLVLDQTRAFRRDHSAASICLMT